MGLVRELLDCETQRLLKLRVVPIACRLRRREARPPCSDMVHAKFCQAT